MLFSRFHLRTLFFGAALFAAVGLTGCGNTCVVGFSINGNGGVIVRAGDPPPPCSLSQAKGAMTALAIKSPVCESCAASTRVDHIFVTLRAIQIRSNAGDNPNSRDWIELAPQLENQPRQFDLLGDSPPAILVENALVPVGMYREVRLQFLTASPSNAETLPTSNACGVERLNCTVMGNGEIGPLHFPADAPELLILPQNIESDSLLVLPDDHLELRLILELRQAPHFSAAEGWKTQNAIVGHAKVVRQKSFELEDSTSMQAF
jgi:hypothetical protein